MGPPCGGPDGSRPAGPARTRAYCPSVPAEAGSSLLRVHASTSQEPGAAQPERSPAPVEQTPERLLERFGLREFRPGQREAVQAALDGRDSLVVMPTGGGKSLCYQLPALADGGLVLVVSPLIALMSDQLRRLNEAGVRAAMLASGMAEGHNAQALREIAAGSCQLVLAAPERFGSAAFREALARRSVALFVVDEAHCVAEWGHDFRPDYLRLHEVISSLANGQRDGRAPGGDGGHGDGDAAGGAGDRGAPGPARLGVGALGL